MTMRDLILASVGRDDDDFPRATAIMTFDTFHSDGSEATPVNNLTLIRPEIRIFRRKNWTTVDMVFPTRYDPELNTAWNMLQNFGESSNSIKDYDKDFPVVRLIVVPKVYKGEYYLLGTNPALWTLQPADMTPDPRVIRMTFNDDDFYAFSDEAIKKTLTEAGEAAEATNEATENV